jgi:hypothetical protein
MVGHPDQHIDPEVPFLDRGLVGRQIAIDHEQVHHVAADGVRDKPFEALSSVIELAVFFDMGISGVGTDPGHGMASPLSLFVTSGK